VEVRAITKGPAKIIEMPRRKKKNEKSANKNPIPTGSPRMYESLTGSGVTVMIVAIVSAMAGTWLYGFLKPRLTH
jgi:hypothetical protein